MLPGNSFDCISWAGYYAQISATWARNQEGSEIIARSAAPLTISNAKLVRSYFHRVMVFSHQSVTSSGGLSSGVANFDVWRFTSTSKECRVKYAIARPCRL